MYVDDSYEGNALGWNDHLANFVKLLHSATKPNPYSKL